MMVFLLVDWGCTLDLFDCRTRPASVLRTDSNSGTVTSCHIGGIIRHRCNILILIMLILMHTGLNLEWSCVPIVYCVSSWHQSITLLYVDLRFLPSSGNGIECRNCWNHSPVRLLSLIATWLVLVVLAIYTSINLVDLLLSTLAHTLISTNQYLWPSLVNHIGPLWLVSYSGIALSLSKLGALVCSWIWVVLVEIQQKFLDLLLLGVERVGFAVVGVYWLRVGSLTRFWVWCALSLLEVYIVGVWVLCVLHLVHCWVFIGFNLRLIELILSLLFHHHLTQR